MSISRNRVLKPVFLIISLILLSVCSVMALPKAAVLSTNVASDYFEIYTDGAVEGRGDINAKFGTDYIDVLSHGTLSELQIQNAVIVLIDTSKSIIPASRQYIIDFMNEFVWQMDDRDLLAIAAFDTEIKMMQDFTGDKKLLLESVAKIAYDGTNTYLYDTVSQTIDIFDGMISENPMYKQIIIFSDGDEDSTTGITKDELYIRLNSARYPIHTLGFEYANNLEDLKVFHSFSRLSGGWSHTAEKDGLTFKNAAENIHALKNRIMYFKFDITKILRDGSVKNLVLDMDNEQFVNCDIKLPIVIAIPEEPEPTIEPTSAPTPEPTQIATTIPTPEPTQIATPMPTPEQITTPVPETEPSFEVFELFGLDQRHVLIICNLVLFFLLAVINILIIRKRRKLK